MPRSKITNNNARPNTGDGFASRQPNRHHDEQQKWQGRRERGNVRRGLCAWFGAARGPEGRDEKENCKPRENRKRAWQTGKLARNPPKQRTDGQEREHEHGNERQQRRSR